MQCKQIGGVLLAFLFFMGHATAATLTVDIDSDEANCNTTGSSPNPACHLASASSYKLSTGCSLREALQDIDDAGIGVIQKFPECGTADTGPGSSNKIVLAGHTIKVNDAEFDPTDSTGVNKVHNGTLPSIGDKATYGTLTITGGAISCFSDASATPAINGVIIFKENSGADATFSGVSFSSCTAPAGGVAITNSGGDLTLTGVTFTGIRGTNQASGGCISHTDGNLTIIGGGFTGCVIDDGGLVPGGGNGQGGALSIGSVGGTTAVTISGVAFQGNIAGQNGGAIYLDHTDVISITGSTFTGNTAFGNTSDGNNNAELGGGAIYAVGTAQQGHGSGSGFNVSDFLIFNSGFIGNLAPLGTGGAILLTSGDLTYGSASFDGTSILNKQIPGGIVASNFTGNHAGGTWNSTPADPRAGSGGAIYAHGNISIIDSSFVGPSIGSNASLQASGGAIAYYDNAAAFSPMAISNVTFNNNSAAVNGGAIANLANGGKITLINDTIAGNSAGAGGALYNASTTPGDVLVSNTIFSSNTGGNCAGNTFSDVTHNLQFNPASGCANIANTGDPSLQNAGAIRRCKCARRRHETQ